MNTALRVASIGMTLVALGCAAEEANAPTAARIPASASGNAADRLVVMTQNMYVGADVDAILTAILTGGDLATVLTEQVQVLQNTEFARRAGALADVLAKDRPHVVGLQEISTIVIDIPALGLDFQVDFLPALDSVLAARNLPYVVAGQVTNFTVSPALPVPGTVSLTDMDVMLVDASRVTVGAPVTAQRFYSNLGTIAPGVTLRRGFVMAPLVVEGSTYLIATTHLEDDLGALDLSTLRYYQMSEIVHYADTYGTPRAIIMGDLNDEEGSPMYKLAADSGFADLWRTLRPATTGYTCCNDPDLANPRPDLNQRIDFIFARGFEGPPGRAMGQIERVRSNPGDKVPGPSYPIWMADHAGLVGTLRVVAPGVTSFGSTVTTSTPAPSQPVTLTITDPALKFLPTASLTHGSGSGTSMAIIARAVDGASLTFISTPGAAPGPLYADGIVRASRPNLPIYDLPSTATVTPPAAYAGTGAFATAPVVTMPGVGDTVHVVDVGSFNASSDCRNVNPGGWDCRIYTFTIAAPVTLSFSNRWGNTTDLGLYFDDAAHSDPFTHACDVRGAESGGQPEVCSVTFAPGTYFMQMTTYHPFYAAPNNVAPPWFWITVTGS